MLMAIAITLIVVVPFGYALRTRRGGDIIVRHPYNNRYNDASAAREDHLDGLPRVRAR